MIFNFLSSCLFYASVHSNSEVYTSIWCKATAIQNFSSSGDQCCAVFGVLPSQIDCVVISVSEETQPNHTVFFKVVNTYIDASWVRV